jgi:hypothetical protein
MKMKNIVVDFKNKVITITHSYSKRAGIVGTHEYCELVAVMKDFSDYTLCVQRAPIRHYTPSPYSKLTYADMESMIMCCEDSDKRETWLNEFYGYKSILPFAHVKSWFVKNVLIELESHNEVA